MSRIKFKEIYVSLHDLPKKIYSKKGIFLEKFIYNF